MNFQDFKPLALRTEADSSNVKVNVAFLEVLLNMAFNVTAVVDDLKKNIYYDKPLDDNRIDSILDAVIMQAAAARLSYKQFKNMPPEQLETLVRPVSEIMDARYLHSVIGIFTEAGELLQTLGKQKGQLNLVNIAEETGDVFWYLALLSDSTGLDVENSMDMVINKLKSRYADKFTTEEAINRDLDTERQVLEDSSK